jgi:hypothetical protein
LKQPTPPTANLAGIGVSIKSSMWQFSIAGRPQNRGLPGIGHASIDPVAVQQLQANTIDNMSSSFALACVRPNIAQHSPGAAARGANV